MPCCGIVQQVWVCAVIVEATYGISRHEPRVEREDRFIRRIRETVLKGGSVLLPIVALGRAQVRACCPVVTLQLHGVPFKAWKNASC